MIERLWLIVFLLLLNAYFVAVEFALVRARRSRLQAMIRAGDPIARFAFKATDPRNLTTILSASQLGITLASLGLGWAAESTLGHAFSSWFSALPLGLEAGVRTSIAAATALLCVTYLHVVFGELAPRTMALNHPEVLAKWLAPPLYSFAWVAKPFIWVLHSSAVAILRLMRQEDLSEADPVHSPEELRILVEQAEEGGAIESEDARMIDAVFEFSEKSARDVMTPRTQVVALPADVPIAAALGTARESGFSRFPVYEASVDEVVGMALVRDLLWAAADGRGQDRVRDVMRHVHVVPGTREVEDVLADFKRRKEHLAIVLDEFGGTAGLVTMEDLLEELVGDIRDELDEATEPAARAAGPGETIVDGSSAIADVNERFGLAIPDSDFTTVGGYIFGELGRLPTAGDRVERGGVTWTVRSMTGRRIESLVLLQPPGIGRE